MSLGETDLGELVELLDMATVIVFGRAQFGGEQSVDERGLSEARLA